jgi:DNA invertase Pin-like site-specific DNA recombinase
LRILGMGVDTGTPTGRLMVNLLGSIAQFERCWSSNGKAPTARAMAAQVMEMQHGASTKEAIAAKLGIGVASVYRVLRDAKDHASSQHRELSAVKGKAATPPNGRMVSD